VPLALGDGAPRDARNQVQAVLDAHGLDGEARALARVIVSELVTNAVVHGSAPITLEVAVGDHTLLLAVHDGSAAAAVVATRAADWGATSGRGLELVESLARRWGVQTDKNGKRVWAEVAIPWSESRPTARYP